MGVNEKIIEKTIYFLAFSAIFILLLITIFIFKEGVPFLFNYGVLKIIFRSSWSPSDQEFGIFAMIIGSIYITLGALIVGIPLGVACAIYLCEFAHKRTRLIIKPTIELLAGIPSVVYGFMGMIVLAPIIRSFLGGSGLSILSASLVLGIMILPTIISISMDSLMALPKTYKEGSIALGATTWQTVIMVLLPAAKSGIIAGIILGLGRAIGETMAVIMIAGNSLKIPVSVLDSTRTMTAGIALEMGYAIGNHRIALFAMAVILFIFILLLNSLVTFIFQKK